MVTQRDHEDDFHSVPVRVDHPVHNIHQTLSPYRDSSHNGPVHAANKVSMCGIAHERFLVGVVQTLQHHVFNFSTVPQIIRSDHGTAEWEVVRREGLGEGELAEPLLPTVDDSITTPLAEEG